MVMLVPLARIATLYHELFEENSFTPVALRKRFLALTFSRTRMIQAFFRIGDISPYNILHGGYRPASHDKQSIVLSHLPGKAVFGKICRLGILRTEEGRLLSLDPHYLCHSGCNLP
jgi:hypothetical protein